MVILAAALATGIAPARAGEPRPAASGPAAGSWKPGDDASALIRSIREREAWIDRLESLSIRAEIRYEVTPAGIAKRRRELRAVFSDERAIAAHRDLRPVTVESIELDFDRHRLRWSNSQDPNWFDLRVWDGRRMILHSSYDTPPDRRAYVIAPEAGRFLSHITAYFDSFRAGPHPLWWAGTPEDREATARLMGRPEDYVYGGREVFHGTECHVASCWDNWTTYYIAVDDGRLRGAKAGALKDPSKRLLNWLNRNGASIGDVAGLAAWMKSRTRAQAREQSANMRRLVDPVFEFWLSDERAIAPGCRLPMTQETKLFFVDEGGRLAVEQTHRLTIAEAKVNLHLPDERFRVEIPPGSHVIDQTKKPPRSRPGQAPPGVLGR